MRNVPDLGENTVMLALFRDNARYELQDHEVLKVLAYSDFHPCSQALSACETAGLGFALGLPVLAHEPEWLLDPSQAGDAPHIGAGANHLVLLRWGNGDVMQAVVADDLDWRPSARVAPGDL
jgi:hypothetical protein